MFIAGLEIDLNEFNRSRNRSLLFGALTFAIPQAIGTLMGVYLLGFSWPSAILLASMFASHTLLAYPTVSRMGLAKNEAVIITVGGTIITDTIALLILAVIASSAGGALGVAFWVTLLLSLTIYTLFMFFGVPRIGGWFFRNVDSAGVTGYVFVLTVVFVSAFLAEVAGVEPIIGAFLAGLSLNRLIPEHSALMNRSEFVGNALFIPFFLISVGMLVDVRVLFAGTEAIIVSVAMIGTVSATKWLAAFLTQQVFDYTAVERTLIFGLSVPQTAATLAAALIGFELGILNEAVLNGSILMILVTSLVGSWMAEDAARTLALQEEVRVPADEMVSQRILVPVANPATVDALMDLAIMIRERHSHEPIRVLSVIPTTDNIHAQIVANEKKLALSIKRAAAADVPVRTTTRVDISPANGILRALTEIRITHVIIGWTGELTARERIFGTVLDQVLAHSSQMVFVCKLEHPLNTMRRLVMVVPPNADHEPRFGELLHTIKVLSRQIGVTMHLLAAEENRGELERLAALTRPLVPTTFDSYPLWSEAMEHLPRLNDEDLIVLVGAREHTVSWRSDLNRTPGQIASRFPHISFVTAYPALIPTMFLVAPIL
ncbi:MAG: cation:proton antiporter, partial [Chloroflexota bacterium]|nr:cation:proton antiporter [Chloroflexota bacterium]